VGGLAYLNAMAQNTPSAANIRRYAEIVRDRSVLRQLITVADDISGRPSARRARKSSRCSTRPNRRSSRLPSRRARRRRLAAVQPLLTQVVERIDELYSRENQSEITGVPTVSSTSTA
jgi:replicative DNA helicase